MPFENFTNPFPRPSDLPTEYREHPSLQALFKSDGSGAYARAAEDPVTAWAIVKLHKDYNVPLEAMRLELAATFDRGTHQGGRRYMGRSDLLI